MSTSAVVPAAGPGDARPTARQIIEREHLAGTMAGKVVLITGASDGIGVEAARALYLTQARLFLPVRNLAKGERVRKGIMDSAPEVKGSIDLLSLDLDSLDSVRQCAAAFLAQSSALHVLMLNAGVVEQNRRETPEGFERTLGVNHLAHFLLFQLLRPALLAAATASSPSRVVVVSSQGHRFSALHQDNLQLTRDYQVMVAYAQSKTANIYMASEIERRYASRHLTATSVYPGEIRTAILQPLPKDTVDGWYAQPNIQRAEKNAEQGAASQVWAAVSQEALSVGGKYIEDCRSAKPAEEEDGIGGGFGYAKHAYDEAAARWLWTESCRLVKEDEEKE